MLNRAISAKNTQYSKAELLTTEKLIFNDYQTPMNMHRKSAIFKAHKEAVNKRDFKQLVKKYTGLTPSGIMCEPYCVELMRRIR